MKYSLQGTHYLSTNGSTMKKVIYQGEKHTTKHITKMFPKWVHRSQVYKETGGDHVDKRVGFVCTDFSNEF
jgi:hypothetical protein